MKNVLMTICLCVLLFAGVAQSQEIAQHLQDVSVTIKAGYSEGSGVIVTRIIDGKKINFVWTAAHVVDGLRRVKDVVTPDGASRKVVSFDDCSLVKELIENGRRVGEMKMDAVVIRYSAKEDLALLRIRKVDFISANAEFHLDPNIPTIGSALFHVGSLLGQAGSNSMTSGIISQIGRVYPGIGKEVFDQTTVAAFPGSSGGGVYLQNGRYIGMLVRGAGETFNLIVPVRRMIRWAKSAGVEWALNSDVDPPSLQEIKDAPIEDVGHKFLKVRADTKRFPYLINVIEIPQRPNSD
jgi:S1-C subfamily serine protease